MFFAVDMARGVRIYELTARHQSGKIPGLKFSFRQRNPNPFSIRPQAYGFFYVYSEIEKVGNEKLHQYRKRPLVKRLLLNYEDPNRITVEEARLFSKEIFAATYEHYRDVESPLTEAELDLQPIGKTMDCAIISFNGAFSWLERNGLAVEE